MSTSTPARRRAQRQDSVGANAVLCWTEYYNGQWQPTKTSDVNLPTSLGIIRANRGHLLGKLAEPDPDSSGAVHRHRPAEFSVSDLQNPIPDDALILAITVSGSANYVGGFVLHNTHSLPTRLDDFYLSHNLLILVPGHPGGIVQTPVRILPLLDQPIQTGPSRPR